MGNRSKHKKNLRLALYLAQGGKCYWCGQQMILKTKKTGRFIWDSPDLCTIDHLTMKCNGGTFHASNVVAACRWCNNHQPFDRYMVNPHVQQVSAILPLLRKGYLNRYKLIRHGYHNDSY